VADSCLEEEAGSYLAQADRTCMAQTRYAPRKLEFETLVKLLVEEHSAMREGLLKVRRAAESASFQEASMALQEVDRVFRQHIADEEASVLRILIGDLGVKGAEQEIKIFQQHRPIHHLMKQIAELASMTASDLAGEQAKLLALFEEHTTAEEGWVFPRALSSYKKKQAPPGR